MNKFFNWFFQRVAINARISATPQWHKNFQRYFFEGTSKTCQVSSHSFKSSKFQLHVCISTFVNLNAKLLFSSSCTSDILNNNNPESNKQSNEFNRKRLLESPIELPVSKRTKILDENHAKQNVDNMNIDNIMVLSAI